MKDWKDVYVFISSTFNDMHAERDYLIKKVFPKISEWCMDRKLRLIDIDLRWGITSDESNSLNNRVVEICLDNINKCRPFFICLLGQRRGWVPTKDDIAKTTFEKIPEINNLVGNYSVTEMEIIHALINPLAMQDEQTNTVKKPERVRNAFFLFRDSSYLETIKNENPKLLNIYTNKLSKSSEEDDKSLESFKLSISEGNSENLDTKWYSYVDYECDFDINQQTLELKNEKFDDGLNKGRLVNFRLKDDSQTELSDYVFDIVTSAIGNEYPDRVNIIDGLEISDEKQQEDFYNRNLVPVIGRSDAETELFNYVQDDSNCPLLLYAEAGTGKTTLMVDFIESLKGKNKNVCYRFAGTSINSMQADTLLNSIIRELYDNEFFDPDQVEYSTDMTLAELLEKPSAARQYFTKLMKIVNKELIIIIDAVNELNETLDDIIWVPDELNKGIKLILTCKVLDDRNMFNRFKNKFNIQIELKNFESFEIRKQMIDQFLSTYLKKISEEEKNQLLAIETTKNPLFLKVLLSELRIYGSFENLRKEIPDFGETTITAFSKVLRRLENDVEYKKYSVPQRVIVQIMFGVLAYTRADISVDDIVNSVLLMEKAQNDKAEEIKESVYGIIRQMKDYLIYHGNKLRYFYDSLRIASAEKYNHNKIIIHSALATIYKNKLWADNDNLAEKNEAYIECTYHLHLAEKHEELKQLLFDYKFLYNKILVCGVEEVLNDLKYLLENYESASILKGVLDKEKNNISNSPMALPTYLWLALENSEDDDMKNLLKDAESMTDYFWVKPFGLNNSVISENKSFSVLNIDYHENSDYDEDDDWYDWHFENDNLYILKNISDDITFLEIRNTKNGVILKDKIQLSKNIRLGIKSVFIVKEKYIYYHQQGYELDNVYKINIVTGKTDLFQRTRKMKEKSYNSVLDYGERPNIQSYLNVIIDESIKEYLICVENDVEVTMCDIHSDVKSIYISDDNPIDYLSYYKNVVIFSLKEAEGDCITVFIYNIIKNTTQKYESVEKFEHSGKYLIIIQNSKQYIWDLSSIELICNLNIPMKDSSEKSFAGFDIGVPKKIIDFFENKAVISHGNNIYKIDFIEKSWKHLNLNFKDYYKNRAQIKKINICNHIAYLLVKYKDDDKIIEKCDIWNLQTFELKSSTEDNSFIYSLFEDEFPIKNYGDVQLLRESDTVSYFVINSITCQLMGKIEEDLYDNKFFISKDKKAVEKKPREIVISNIVDIDISKSSGGYYDAEFTQCDNVLYTVDLTGHYIKVWGRDLEGEEIYSPIILNINEKYIENDLLILKTTENKSLFINLKNNSDKSIKKSWVADNYIIEDKLSLAEDDYIVENDKIIEDNTWFNNNFGFSNIQSNFLNNNSFNISNYMPKVHRMQIDANNYKILLFDDNIIVKSDESEKANETALEFNHNLKFPIKVMKAYYDGIIREDYYTFNDDLFIYMAEGFININLLTLKYKIILFSDIINLNNSKVSDLLFHNNKSIILTKEKIYIIDLKKLNCDMEVINTMHDRGLKLIRSINDEEVCFVFFSDIYILNYAKDELVNKRAMFPKDLLKLRPLASYFDGNAFVFMYVHFVYVWDVINDSFVMKSTLEQPLKNEGFARHIRLNDNYIEFCFDNFKVSVDYVNSTVIQNKYLEDFDDKYQIIRSFMDYNINVWLFDKAIFIQDSKTKNVLCQGEHGLKIGQLNKEHIEVVLHNKKLYVLMKNNIILCDLTDGSIKTHPSYISPKYLRKFIEDKMFFYKEDGSLKISEECIIYQNPVTENMSVIPLSNKNAYINGYVYINKDGKAIRLLPLNANW